MDFHKIPCHRCPQHSKFFKTNEATKATALVHTCRENWYAEMEPLDSVHQPDDPLAQLEKEQLQAFWEKPRHRWLSCPYRREKFLYKAIPLILSTLALIASAANNDAVKPYLGISPKDPKPMKLEQPIQVTIQADSSKSRQPAPVAPQANLTNANRSTHTNNSADNGNRVSEKSHKP